MTINEKLSFVELNSTNTTERTIIWMHGLGADGNDFAPIVPELNLPKQLGIKFLFPNAPSIPVSLNNGYVMPAWFNITGPDLSANIDEEGISRSAVQIEALIDAEIERGISCENIMIAGFSQGAVIALNVGTSYRKKLGGIIAISGLLPNSKTLLERANPANQDTPIFMAHGTQDMMVPIMLGDAAHQLLLTKGYHVNWHTYPIAHGVCPDEINDISQWIQNIWRI